MSKLRLVTIGDPVFESEYGANIGYDNVQEHFVEIPPGVDPGEFALPYYESGAYRTVEVI